MANKVTAEEISQVDKLAGVDNFQLWKFEVTVLLKASELYNTVIGDPPANPDDAWKKKDANAQKVIVLSVTKKTLMHVINCNTAHEMWLKLCSIYERDSEHQKYALMKEFFSYSMDKSSDVATHISKLESVICRLKALGAEVTDSMLISKILTCLPDTYKTFAIAWESTPTEEQTVENLTARLLMEENRNTEQKEKEDTVAFKTSERRCFKCNTAGHTARACRKKSTESSKNDKRCFTCNKFGHISKECSKNSKEKMYCKICKKNNHREKDCYFRDKTTKKNEETEKVSFLVQNKSEGKWIMDSGTTSHMVNDKKWLTDLKKEKSTVDVAKVDESMTSIGRGSVISETCILKDVMYVPELSTNLLSVKAIARNGGKVLFTENEVIVKKEDKEVMRGITGRNGLYEVNLSIDIEENLHRALKIESAENWHRRLGHLSVDGMRSLMHKSKGLNITEKMLKRMETTCEICLKAKQTRLPFGEERERAKRPLEILHTDVCGPVEVPTWDGKRYMLTILDDYTHFTVIYLLKNKHEVYELIKEYVEQVEVKWKSRVVKLRCDNGREYCNENMKNWSKKKGILLDFTVPYTPQLNGKAERLNRTLMEKVRALITESKMKKEMWGEAAYTATYLLNRSPTKTLSVTPYEKWNGKKPGLSNLRLFGSKAYAKNLGQLRKLDDRSKKFILVGYAPNGYRLWDSEKRKIVVARDVKIEENTKEKMKDKKNKTRNLKLKFLEEEEDEEEDEKKLSEEEEEEDKKKLPKEEEDVEEEETEEEDVQGQNSSSEQDAQEKEESDEEEFKNTIKVRKSTRTKKSPQRYGECANLTYEQAITGPNRHKWKKAIEEEKKSLKENKTWRLVDRTEAAGRKILSSMWIFKIKENGINKARLVVRGCEQKYGIDFNETFSPVVDSSSLRILFALAVKRNYHLVTFDIKTAFLNGELDKDIYMYPPKGYNYGNRICKLQKALYGLKQAPMESTILSLSQ